MTERETIPVTAFSALSAYDKKDVLLSTIKLRVPHESVDFLGFSHTAQEDETHRVNYSLVITHRTSGTVRRIGLRSRGSEMPRFIPLHVFTKYGDHRDNLTQLFDTGHYGTYDLHLLVSVEPLHENEQELFSEPAEPAVPAWVLAEQQLDAVAQERMLGEGCPHCPDYRENEALTRVVGLIERASHERLCSLLESVGIDPTDWDDPKKTPEQDMAEMRRALLPHWPLLVETEKEHLAD